jgi:4-amino-4-deoxy-L-arabinose transferase-like glycosyltransferase
MGTPDWIGHVLRCLAGVLGGAFALGALFAAVVMPYRLWDSLAFGSWSRSIAETGDLWTDAPALYVQRPLFYVAQGLAWKTFGDDEWIGRVLSLSFAAILVVAVWMLARSVSTDRAGRLFLPPLAASLVFASSVFATYAAAGMSDVPVAAMAAATGVAAWAARPTIAGASLVAVLAAATILAKPSGLLALAGLATAVFVLRGRAGARAAVGIAAGAALALAYEAWQAARLDEGFTDLLTAGNDEFWRERGAAARWDSIARAEWLGEGLRLLVLFALVNALARASGARPRMALGTAAAVAIAWSVGGPAIADGDVSYPFDGSVPGLVAWLTLAAGMVVAPFLAAHDPVGRRTYAALLAWLAPTGLAWAWQRADEVRHLAPAWAPLVLLTAAALASMSLALVRLRPAAALAPAAAVAVLALANLVSIDGLGRNGWSDLLELGPSGWGSRAEMENFAYGPFSYELNLARENVGGDDRIVSSNGRLAYFFPGRVEFRYARACAELDGARFFSYLTAGESLEFATLEGQPTEPLGWIQCTQPRVTLVGEQEGIYAAFVVGAPPARPPAPEDCRIVAGSGQLLDAVFGAGLSYGDAKALREQAETVGFEGVRIERTGCSTFRVVVTGVPTDPSVQDELRKEVESVGLEVTFAEAARYPEVPGDIAAVE